MHIIKRRRTKKKKKNEIMTLNRTDRNKKKKTKEGKSVNGIETKCKFIRSSEY